MDIQVKSSSGIALIPADTRLLAQRKVFIEGEIDSRSACEFAKKIMILEGEDSKKPIDVFVNSTGGEVISGFLMYDIIQSAKVPIRMYCLGTAYSMAAVLVACGNHGRYILPHGEMMIHEPLLGNRVGGSTSSIRSISDSLMETKYKLIRVLAKHTGKTEEEVEKATGFDNYMTPEECVEFGLCDKIITFDMIESCE